MEKSQVLPWSEFWKGVAFSTAIYALMFLGSASDGNPLGIFFLLLASVILFPLICLLVLVIFTLFRRFVGYRVAYGWRLMGYVLPAVVVLLLQLLGPETSGPRQVQGLKSPSGKYVLRVPIRNGVWQLTIYDARGRREYRDDDSDLRGMFNVYWCWDGQDRPWLYNSDDGAVYYWTKAGESWRRVRYEESDAKNYLAKILPPRELFPDYVFKDNDKPEMALQQQQLKSPDGQYVLFVPRDDKSVYHPVIYNSRGEMEYLEPGKDLGGNSYYWCWDEAGRAWLASVNNVYYYLEKRDGQWRRQPWSEGGASAGPAAITPPRPLRDHIQAIETEIRQMAAPSQAPRQ